MRMLLSSSVAIAALFVGAGAFAQSPTLVEVWRSPSCGCCGDWVRHLQANGFATKVHMVEDTTDARQKARIPQSLGSCHTAKVAGYALEGHVPAREIRRLLTEKPKAVGLAVPGMPMGSPGMEGPVSHSYDVLLVSPAGTTSVYAAYPARSR